MRLLVVGALPCDDGVLRQPATLVDLGQTELGVIGDERGELGTGRPVGARGTATAATAGGRGLSGSRAGAGLDLLDRDLTGTEPPPVHLAEVRLERSTGDGMEEAA